MPRRDAIPLHRKRQTALIDTLNPRENNVDQNKGIATHLLLGTGIRNDTCGHVHSDWFKYEGGELYLQVPPTDRCRKDTRTDVCSVCNEEEEKPWYPKTPASEGRMIHVGNYYHDYTSDERKYFGLRDRVESYFAVSPSDEKAAIGYNMIQANGGNGVSRGTLNRWIRGVCTEAGISAEMRKRRLKKELEPDELDDHKEKKKENLRSVDEKIKYHGEDDQGRVIPDIFAHDLRATYCTQLCRDPSPNYTEIRAKTGHKHEETLYRYVGYAGSELDPEKDAQLF